MTNMAEYKEFLERVESADNWCDIEADEYKEACDFVGIDYYMYDDPDELFSMMKIYAGLESVNA